MPAVELATGYVSLAVTAKGLGRELSKEFSQASGIADKAGKQAGSRFSSSVGSAMRSATKIAGGAALALGGVATAGVAAGIKTAASMEQASISFETMLGSAQKSEKFLKDLQKFAASTPFEFPELQTAASSLISAGIEADKVIPIMRTLGDVTSGMGTGSEGVQRATVALQQMAAAGRITGEDLNQLRDAGIPVYDLLAKATGKSKKEIVELAQAGKLGKTELDAMMKALESGKGLERFSGLMAKQSQSLTGMWSTLKDTLGQGLATALEPAIPALKKGMTTVSNLLADAFKALPGIITNVQEVFAKVDFGGMFRTAKDAVEGFGRSNSWGLIVSAFQALWAVAKPTFEFFRDVALPAVRDLLSFIDRHLVVFTSLAVGIGTIVVALKAYALYQRIIIAVTKAWAAVQAAMNLVLAANPIGIIVLALAGLVAGLVYAYKNSEKFRDIVNGAWAAVKAGAKAAFDWIANAVRVVIDFVSKNWKSLLPLLAGPIGLAFVLIRKHWDTIKGAFTSAVRWVKATFAKGWNALKEIYLAPVRWARDKIGEVLGQVKDKFRDGVSAISRIWDGLKAKAKAPIKFVIDTVLNGGLIAAFNQIADMIPGVDKIDPVTIPGFHRGGIEPGRSSWRHGDTMLRGFRPGEGVTVSEALTDSYERARLLALNKWTLAGKSAASFRERFGYARGGLVGGSGRFSPLFESRLMLASQMANTVFHIFQRGFRPATSYSGTSHQGDAVDLGPITTAVIRALRAVGVAAWDRTGKGNWSPHIHGVPLPGAGFAAGSAVWQAQDYLRGGDGLGGRDNGPNVSVLGKIGAFIKSGFASFSEWFGNLVKDPLAKLKSITGSPFGQLAAGVPRLLVEGMRNKVNVFDNGGRLQPGLTFNGTRRSELVLNRPQERIVERALDLANSGGGVTINGGVHGFSAEDVAREILKLQRRERALQPSFV